MTTSSPPRVDRGALRHAIDEVFSDAPQQSSATEFGTLGINFQARKLAS